MDSTTRLKDLKTRLNQSVPESDHELQSAENSNQVPTDAASASETTWGGGVREP